MPNGHPLANIPQDQLAAALRRSGLTPEDIQNLPGRPGTDVADTDVAAPPARRRWTASEEHVSGTPIPLLGYASEGISALAEGSPLGSLRTYPKAREEQETFESEQDMRQFYYAQYLKENAHLSTAEKRSRLEQLEAMPWADFQVEFQRAFDVASPDLPAAVAAQRPPESETDAFARAFQQSSVLGAMQDPARFVGETVGGVAALAKPAMPEDAPAMQAWKAEVARREQEIAVAPTAEAEMQSRLALEQVRAARPGGFRWGEGYGEAGNTATALIRHMGTRAREIADMPTSEQSQFRQQADRVYGRAVESVFGRTGRDLANVLAEVSTGVADAATESPGAALGHTAGFMTWMGNPRNWGKVAERIFSTRGQPAATPKPGAPPEVQNVQFAEQQGARALLNRGIYAAQDARPPSRWEALVGRFSGGKQQRSQQVATRNEFMAQQMDDAKRLSGRTEPIERGFFNNETTRVLQRHVDDFKLRAKERYDAVFKWATDHQATANMDDLGNVLQQAVTQSKGAIPQEAAFLSKTQLQEYASTFIQQIKRNAGQTGPNKNVLNLEQAENILSKIKEIQRKLPGNTPPDVRGPWKNLERRLDNIIKTALGNPDQYAKLRAARRLSKNAIDREARMVAFTKQSVIGKQVRATGEAEMARDVFSIVNAKNDKGIGELGQVLRDAPELRPLIRRAWLDELTGKTGSVHDTASWLKTAAKKWDEMGAGWKDLVFGEAKPGVRQNYRRAVDDFFTQVKMTQGADLNAAKALDETLRMVKDISLKAGVAGVVGGTASMLGAGGALAGTVGAGAYVLAETAGSYVLARILNSPKLARQFLNGVQAKDRARRVGILTRIATIIAEPGSEARDLPEEL